MIQLPYRILAVALLIGAAGAGGFAYGVGVGKDRQIAAAAKADGIVRRAVEASVTAAQVADLAAVVAAQRTSTIFREIRLEVPTIIDRPVYRNVCVDADGVRALDRAVDAANGGGASGGGPDGDAARIRESADRGRPGDG